LLLKKFNYVNRKIAINRLTLMTMKNKDELKKVVTEKYTEVAEKGGSCCSSDCDCLDNVSFIGENYQDLKGYNPDADLGLGCGLPTEYAKIKEKDVVVDLGSGAGNDSFVARAMTGPQGKIIGIDFTPAMIEKAVRNAETLGHKNVHFIEGDIEKIPLENDTADVVVSNCVMNLVPDKELAFSETFRILKPGGHFSISDVVIKGDLPDEIKQSAEMYAGCVSGAVSKDSYLDIIKEVGFENITVQRENKVNIPNDVLGHILNPDQIDALNQKESGVFSITVYGEKPSPCCEPSCCN